MASSDVTQWETSIARVISTDEEEETLIRGERLSDLIGNVSFAEATFLLLLGRRPDKAQARVLDALLVAAIEHGIAPPSMISRCMASYGSPIQAAIGAGVLTFGDRMGGAGEQLAQLLSECVAALPQPPSEDSLKGEAERIVTQARAQKARIPGYGIPLHGMDPRAPKLLEIARQEGVLGPHSRLAELIAEEFARQSGRSVPMNLDGAGACIILDLGFPWQSSRMFIITPRTVSMAAHFLEEQAQDTRWRHIPADRIAYKK